MDKDQAAQDDTRLKNATLTLSDYWAEQGEDWRDKLRQRARELELGQALGIPAPPEKGGPQPEVLPPDQQPPDQQPPTPPTPPEPSPRDPKRNGQAQPARAALNGHYRGGA